MPKTCNRLRFCTKWLILAATLSLGACASHPPAPMNDATADYSYKIGPGDSLNIVVWRNPELSMSVPVRPDGKISAPLIDDLAAIGKDSTLLARDIEKELSKFIRDPVVTVIVTGFVGQYSEQIRVVGEAAKPQILAYKQKMTILDVMIATILRTSENNAQYGVRLKDLIKNGDVSANVEMKPGDVVIIPQSWF